MAFFLKIEVILLETPGKFKMYQYAIVFISTVILTASITKWFYAPSIQKIKTPSRKMINPSNIPTLSQEKHDEYMRLKTQWASTHAATTPQKN